VAEALKQMSARGKLDGLILDNRMNSGGASTVLHGALSFFTQGTLGYYVNRQQEEPLYVDAVDVNGSQELPLVVLIGRDTVSFGEVFAGILQDTGRAYLIGEKTDGNVEILYIYDFEDGSRAWIAHDTFRPLIQTDQVWEETGILPNLEIVVAWDEVTLDEDPVVYAALEYFDEN
jgi:carboxyl-terminal processing protease